MALLDIFVHNSKPPLKQPFVLFDRVSFSLIFNSSVILWFHLVGMPRHGIFGYLAYMLVCQVTTALDGLMSCSMGNNIRRLRRRKYSDATILFFMEFNLFTSQLLGYVTMVHLIPRLSFDDTRRKIEEDGLYVLGAVIANLSVTEVLFMLSHELLHVNDTLKALHVFHHCCTEPSWSTNLLFHPIDLALEFGGPAVSLFALHFFVWKDPILLATTYLIFQLWYAYDHDEHLRLYHTRHHTNCDALYAIYTPISRVARKEAAKRNSLRRDMQDILTASMKTK